jgi:tetratricopeptide (TPR) repeat protein
MSGRSPRQVNVLTMLPIGILGGLLLSSPAFAAIPEILTPSDVTITEQENCAVIRVAFSFVVRLVRHFPQASGDDLRIQFVPFGVSAADREGLFTRRSVRPRRSDIASLAEVVYEGNVAGGPFLTLFFTRPRMFRVEEGKDFRSLIIVVRGEGPECPPVGPGPPAKRAPVPKDQPPARATAEKPEAGPPQVSEERLAQLMEEAAKAVTRGDHRQAVEYYTKILEYPRHRFSQEAQELLGLARERAGQLAHARAEYEKYLELYPKGEGADRVRQRLAGLLTARATPQEKLPETRAPQAATAATTDIHGSLSQFYQRSENFTDQGGNVVTRSLLSTDLDFAVRRRTAAYQLSSVFSGGYDHSFLADDGSDFTLSRLYLDVLHRQRGISARLGRETRSTDGVLGRFDGAVLGYQPFRPIKVNALFGFPVDDPSQFSEYETNKYFYGASLDLGTFAERWNFNLYAIQQEAEGILDRQAVGADARYVDAGGSLFALVDYDVSYDELNTILAVANWIFPDRTTFYISFDQRKTPILTTSNALIGQPVDSLSALLRTLSEDEVRDLARDRTATSRSLMLGITRPLGEKLQVGGDVTVSESTGTPASGGVEAVPATGYEYFFSFHLVGSNLIKDGDVAIVALRYSNTSSADTIGLDLNIRYPLGREWRINPKIQVDYRQLHPDDTDEVKIRPALTIDYYLMRLVRLQVEAGVDWTPKWLSNDTENMDFFLTVGYGIDF